MPAVSLMLNTDALATIAQVGVGLAGFSGVAIILTRSSTELLRVEAYRLGIMLGSTFGATFLALVALIVGTGEVDAEIGCRVMAGVMASFCMLFLIYYGAAIRHIRSAVPELVAPIPVALVFCGYTVNVLLQLGSMAALLRHCAAIYLIGLIWLLFHGAYQFARILFIRPPAG